MSGSIEQLPPSSSAPRPLLIPTEDFMKMLAECDALQARIDEIKAKLGLPVIEPSRELVALPEVLAELTRRLRRSPENDAPAMQFIRGSLDLATKSEI